MEGTKHDDVIVGTAQDDSVNSRAGNDDIETLGGNDFVAAGEGSDTIKTGEGADTVLGDVEYELTQANPDVAQGDDSWGTSHTVYEFEQKSDGQQTSHSIKLDNFAVNQSVNTSTSAAGFSDHDAITVELTDEEGTIIATQLVQVNADGTIDVDIDIPESSIVGNGEVTFRFLDQSNQPITSLTDMDIQVRNIYDDTIDGVPETTF